jgi:hypothetical protein
LGPRKSLQRYLREGHREDAGGQELYQLSIEAYEKCLSLLPRDAQWHAGFADLLANHSYWDLYLNGPTAETYRALNEIQTALGLAPNDPIVQEIAQNISYMFPDGIIKNGTGYDFPWLTQTRLRFRRRRQLLPFTIRHRRDLQSGRYHAQKTRTPN